MYISKVRAVGPRLNLREFSNSFHSIFHLPIQYLLRRQTTIKNIFQRGLTSSHFKRFPEKLRYPFIIYGWDKSRKKCGFPSCNYCILQYSTIVSNDRRLETTSEIFPAPLCTLNTLNTILTSRLGCPPVYNFYFFVDSESQHVCELHLDWPECQVFSASAHKKKAAQAKASLQALHWLYSKKLIDRALKPVLRDAASSRNTILLDLSDPIIAKIDAVLKVHSEEVVPALTTISSFHHPAGNHINQTGNIHPTLGIPFPNVEDLEEWNRTLKSREKTFSTKIFPIDISRENILESIKCNRVIVLKGETGCGKTTRVPQFILDEAISVGKGAFCNIAVTQPRRMTTIEIANFVAKEREEEVGITVGYSVKMQSVLPKVPGGSIVFLTGMKLALKFIGNPSLNGISHVILDEAHMRDIGTDLVMTLLKRAMKLNTNLKVIIMSATANTISFQSYFNCFGDVPLLNVSGRTFPVKRHFLNDLPDNIVGSGEDVYVDPKVNHALVQRLVLWINERKPPGGILIFVSGWNDMTELKKAFLHEESLLIIPVHSMLRDFSCAFEPAPDGKRKVILATNIAETSVTFPDIVYVIDCGIHKKPQRDFLSPVGWSTSRMSTEWITKANLKQRAGRAGRVQPGESFHLFTEEMYRKMDEFESPAVMSESLEYLILSIKTVNPDVKAGDLMKEFPSPPNEEDIQQAVHTLQAANLLSVDEHPTPLAAAVMSISASLPSALALIYSAIFRCFSLTLSVVSSEEAQLVFGSMHEDATVIRSLKESYHRSSDHLAKGKSLCDPHMPFYSHPGYDRAKDLQGFLKKQITFMSDFFNGSSFDDFSSQELVQSVFLSCFGSIIVKSYGKYLNVYLNDKCGLPARVNSKSINFNSENLKFPFLMYLSGYVSNNTLLVNDTTVVSPLSILLFLPGCFQTTVDESFTTVKGSWLQDNVRIRMKNEHYIRIRALRKALNDVVDYFIITEALNQPDNKNSELLCHFRKILLDCIVHTLKLEWDQNIEVKFD